MWWLEVAEVRPSRHWCQPAKFQDLSGSKSVTNYYKHVTWKKTMHGVDLWFVRLCFVIYQAVKMLADMRISTRESGFVLFQLCYIDLKFSLNNGCCNSDYKCWGHYSGRVTYYTSLVTLKSNSVSPTLPSHSCPSLHLKKSHVYTRYSKSASLYHFLPPTHARKSADCSRESVQEIKNMFLSVRPAGRELKNDIIVTVM